MTLGFSTSPSAVAVNLFQNHALSEIFRYHTLFQPSLNGGERMKGKSWKSWSLRDGEAIVLPGPLVSLLGFPV